MKSENIVPIKFSIALIFLFLFLIIINYFIFRQLESILDEIILFSFILISFSVSLLLFKLDRKTKLINSDLIKLKQNLKNISEGVLSETIECEENNTLIKELIDTSDDIKSMIFYATDFVKNIEKRNLDADYKGIINKRNELSNALMSMREQMNKITKEESQRNWTTVGLAKFADILRENNDDEKNLHYQVVSNLVKYTDSTQGGLFVVNEKTGKNAVLTLMAYYAYDRKKYTNKEIHYGEGLIGQSFAEKNIIYLKEVPENYVNVTSGLGQSNPTSVLIVPLIVNDEVYGIIELASFEDYPQYKIDFIEKVGQNIASSLANVKNMVKTQSLLNELKKQTQEMLAKEEEMHQNMEELKATQEDGQRRQTELERYKVKLEKKNIIAKRNEQILKKAFSDIKQRSEKTEIKLKEISEKKSELEKEILEYNKFKEKNELQKQEFQFLIDALNFGFIWKDVNSTYLKVNKYFLNRTKFSSLDEIIGKTDLDLFSEEMAEKYMEEDRVRIVTNTSLLDFDEQEKQVDNKLVWTRRSKIPILNNLGNVTGMISIFKDVSKEKEKEKEYLERILNLEENEEILKQKLLNIKNKKKEK